MMTANRFTFLASARTLVLWLSGAFGVLLLAALLLNEVIHSSDPRSIRYQLWKAGWVEMDRNNAIVAFYLDASRESVVLGKSEAELSRRFGPLARPDELMPYYRDFAHDPRWNGKKVRYIKGTAWLIAFQNDKAVDLLLVKG
jgi:hypothetical protein